MITVYCPDGHVYEASERSVAMADEHECCYKYVYRTGYSSYLTPKGIAIAEGRCTDQALYNMNNAYSDLGLKRVFGSVAIGVGKRPVFEYGDGKVQTYKELVGLGMMTKESLDCHCWLEDKKGRIYDVATSMFRAIALIADKKYKFDENQVLEGITLKEAAAGGIHYVPFPPQLQAVCEMQANKLSKPFHF